MQKTLCFAAFALALAQSTFGATTLRLRYYFRDNTRESSGHKYNAYKPVDTTFGEGYVPGCKGIRSLVFNGKTSMFKLPEAPVKNIGLGKMSLLFRFKVDEDAFAGTVKDRVLWSASNANNQFIMRLTVRNDGKVVLYGNGKRCSASSRRAFTPGKWAVFTLIRERQYLYLDSGIGQCEASYNLGATKTGGHILGSDFSNFKPFKGRISDVDFFNTEFKGNAAVNLNVVRNPQTCKGSNDLVMRFKLKNKSLKDMSGNKFNAVSFGPKVSALTQCAAGKYNAVYFPAGGANHMALKGGIMQGLIEFTFATWINPDKLVDHQAFFNYAVGVEANAILLGLKNGELWIDVAEGRKYTSRANVKAGVFSHIAVVQKGHSLMAYVNGKQIQTFELATPSVLIGNGASKALAIGVHLKNGDGTAHDAWKFVGYMYDFRMYQVGLSAEAIQEMSSTKYAPTTGCPDVQKILWRVMAITDSFVHTLWESVRAELEE